MIEEGVGGQTLTAEEARDDRILHAIRLGFKFIDLELNQAHVQWAQKEVRLSGVKIVDVFRDGFLRSGLPKDNFVIKGGYIIFRLDPIKLKWMAKLLDDENFPSIVPATIERGLNWRFLVNHWNDPKEDWAGGDKFIIADPDVRKEIEYRYNIERAKAKKRILKLRKEGDKDGLIEMDRLVARFRFSLETIEDEPVIEIPKEVTPETVDPSVIKENEDLKARVAALEDLIKKGNKPKRKARRRKPAKKTEVAHANNKTNDNDAAAGSERLEQGRGPGDSAGP